MQSQGIMCGSCSSDRPALCSTPKFTLPAAFLRFLSWCNCQRIMVAFKGIWTKDFWRAVSGEYLATLIFVFLGLGSTINWAPGEEKPPPADLVLISLCFGLSIATMVQCFSHISGGHINPAVTAAMVVTRKLSLAKALFYVVAQCLGAITGAGILYLVTPAAVRGSFGVTMMNSNISLGHGLLVELLITFELVFTVFATCDPKRTDLGGSAGLAIGFAVAIGHLFAIPYTGASMNPARSFGPAVVTLNFENHWVYWVGPILGGILAAGLYEYLYCPDPDIKKRLKQVFQKDPSVKYREVDTEDIKPGSIHTISDLEKAEKKHPFQDSTGEVLSSV
ncbi:aquaporin-4 isoform X2 [Micropterus dolomieu]|uniref:aquaporin-4 isoform X2 n=1 Tax=Micropterus dolomieu TaxID=147949 RepID=UPI001E8D5F09|nr:aquaporin-4 isoform X2 [Micropterus dolomieu]XP_045908593.1 aquaporin-4 isoform X2 [Micropterus dolomieu]XP_045908594.1 aquaporin-4 isoform X2 [Micropterus dolomieu]XP_045908595.1 aquaporin-4 isoform X2 [Micropterus dolomieu]XP_045908596.1 aquaporin-4 isoform X2 [Micropterus dolomieu]